MYAVFNFEIKYFKYFQTKQKVVGGVVCGFWDIGSHAVNLLYRQILIKFILIIFMYLIGYVVLSFGVFCCVFLLS